MSPLEVAAVAAGSILLGVIAAELQSRWVRNQRHRELVAYVDGRADVDEKYRNLFVTYAEYVTPIKVMRLRNACEDLLVHSSSGDGWVPRADQVGLPAREAFERDMRALQAAVTDLGKATR